MRIDVEVQGRLTRLDADVIVLGRSSDSDVIVPHESVSRTHLEVRRTGSHWTASDVGSANGSWVNGRRVSDVIIDKSLQIRLGTEGAPVVTIRTPRVDGPLTYRGISESVDSPNQTVSVQAGTPLADARFRIGRDQSNDIVVPDVQVSRHHAEVIIQAEGSARVRDLRSSNGTFVDGNRVRDAVLAVGDSVVVGTTALRFNGSGFEVFSEAGLLGFEVVDLNVVGEAGKPILSDVSLSIPPASLVAVLGPSGAGKSTFIKAIVGATPVASGEVRFGGIDLISGMGSARRAIGYVPQDDVLHDPLSVTDSLRYAARLRLPSDTSSAEIDGQISLVLDQLNLAEHREKLISNLSGGQRKRVSTAMELLTGPPLLMLDEPSSGLDPGNEKSLMELLRDLAKDSSHAGGRRILVVTHSVQSLDLCDLVLVLKPGSPDRPGGAIAYFGRPADLLAEFGTTDFADVFQLLEAGQAPRWVLQDPALRPANVPFTHSDAVEPQSPLSWLQQLRLLTGRYARIVLADWRNVALLSLQAPVIGLLLLLVSGDAFSPPVGSPSSKAVLLLLGLVLSITYLGTSNSVREIVKERPIFLRERALGLRESAYLVSKALVLLAIAIPQGIVLTLVGVATAGEARLPRVVDWMPSATTSLAIVVVAVGFSAVMLGLLISSVVTNADKAMSLLPVVLLGLYFLSNGPAKLEGVPVVEQVSYLNPVRWGLANAAIVTDAPDLLLCDADVSGAPDPFRSDRCRDAWEPSTPRLLGGLWVLGIVGLGSGVLSVIVLKRRRF